jgi:hypothetical protein
MWKMNYSIPSRPRVISIGTTLPRVVSLPQTGNLPNDNKYNTVYATQFFTGGNMFLRIKGDPCFSCGQIK